MTPTVPTANLRRPDRTTIKGVLAESKDGVIVVAVPDTDYRLQLVLAGPMSAQPGEKVEGSIHAQARRIDVIKSGGAYVEPVFGRPRRVQGRIVAVDGAADTVTVNAGAGGVVCKCNGIQKASQFQVDQLVSFDVAPGATFTPKC